MVKIKQNFISTRNEGFTILETFVALAIFVSCLVGLIVIVAGSVSNVNYVKNKLTASYLAQEPIEILVNMRDTGQLTGTQSWNSFEQTLANPSTGNCRLPNGCAVSFDYTTQAFNFSAYCTPACAALHLSRAGFYGYVPSDPVSIFTRFVTVAPLNPGTPNDELLITSTVSWPQGLVTDSVSQQETLFNWVPTLTSQ